MLANTNESSGHPDLDYAALYETFRWQPNPGTVHGVANSDVGTVRGHLQAHRLRPCETYLALLAAALALAACASSPAHWCRSFSRGYPQHDCPDSLDGQVRLEVEVQSVEVTNPGAVGRRLFVSVTPAGLRAADEPSCGALSRLLHMAARSAGGISCGNRNSIRAHKLQPSRWRRGNYELPEWRAARRISPACTRSMCYWHLAASPWTTRSCALRGSGMTTERRCRRVEVTAQLGPVRHPPGLDTVEADFTLDFVVRLGNGGDDGPVQAEVRKTLLDQEAVRQPFWDLGLASANSARREWLALFDPALGGVRLVFDSPAAARSFAEWMRATRSTQVGHYAVRAFRQSPQSLRPLADREIDAIAVGPLGEP